MSDQDLVRLYSSRILALAAAIPHLGRLEAPAGTARRRSPQCGSTITADVMLEDGRIAGFAQEVRACALGQASAALLGEVVLGRCRAEIQAGRDAVAAMLNGEMPPEGHFAGYQVLVPARDYRNRHASILLSLDALLAAMDDAAAKSAAASGLIPESDTGA